jgi:hypothetical protein
MYLRINGREARAVRVEGAQREKDWILVKGSQSGGYSERTIEITW